MKNNNVRLIAQAASETSIKSIAQAVDYAEVLIKDGASMGYACHRASLVIRCDIDYLQFVIKMRAQERVSLN